MRAALYWVPALDDPLFAAGTAWLGRDAETGATVKQPDIEGIAALTEDARRYGLHATLRPPMRLATGWEEFYAACHRIAESCAPFALPPLALCDVGGFLALREARPCPALQALADRCVLGTERHRLRPDEDELARRRAAGLTEAQEAMLAAYGYPYVMEEWFFHVTLTRRLDARDMARIGALAEAHFAPVLGGPRHVADICICTQLEGDFRIAERVSLNKKAGGMKPSPLTPGIL
jgi:hypothetical protein